MTKKHLLERLIKLAALSVLLSTSSCAVMVAQESAVQKKEATNKKDTLTPAEKKAREAVLKDWVEMAVKSEGAHLYLYKDTAGNITWGIGTKYTPDLFAMTEFRHEDGSLLTRAEKSAYLRAARAIKSTNYGPYERLAQKMGVTIKLEHAKKIALFEANEIWDTIQPKIKDRYEIDINKIQEENKSSNPIASSPSNKTYRPTTTQKTISHAEKIIIVDLAFNVGENGVMRFKNLFHSLQAGNLQEAKKHISVNADGNRNIAREQMKALCMDWAIAEKKGMDTSNILAQFREFDVTLPSVFKNPYKANILLALSETGKMLNHQTTKKNHLIEQPQMQNGVKNPVWIKWKNDNSLKG